MRIIYETPGKYMFRDEPRQVGVQKCRREEEILLLKKLLFFIEIRTFWFLNEGIHGLNKFETYYFWEYS